MVEEDQEFQALKAVGTQVPQEDTLNIFGEVPRYSTLGGCGKLGSHFSTV